jgi:hypothetical protein
MARTGKIARLPIQIREKLNRRILDGQVGTTEILPWLNSLDAVRAILADQFDGVPISDANLTEWRQGGYADWLRDHERADRLRTLSEYSLQLAQAAGGDLAEGGAAIATGRILEMIEHTDDDDLDKLVSSLVSLRNTELTAHRVRADRDRLTLKQREVALAEDRFRRDTAELFLAWHADLRAKEIAESTASKTVKMDELIQLMFGDAPAPAA